MQTTDKERLTKQFMDEARRGMHKDLPSVDTTMERIFREQKEGKR